MTTIQNDSNELSGKRVLVTGGTKGMGEAIVRRLRRAGATVITTARNKPNELQQGRNLVASCSSDSAVRRPMRRISEVAHLASNQSLEATADRRENFPRHDFDI